MGKEKGIDIIMKKKHRLLKVLLILVLLYAAYRIIVPVLLSDRPGMESYVNPGEETIVSWMIDRVSKGEVALSDEDSIRQALAEGEKEFDLSLTEENKDRIVGFMQTLDSIEVGAEDFMDQAKQMYHKYSAQLVEGANEAINEAVESAAEGAARNFFDSLKHSAQNFWGNLTSGDDEDSSD